MILRKDCIVCTKIFYTLTNSVDPDEMPHYAGFYTKLNVWGPFGLNFDYDGGPIIEIGGPIFSYKSRILEVSTSFLESCIVCNF